MDYLGLTLKGYADPVRQMVRPNYNEPVKILSPEHMRDLTVLDVYTYHVDGFARGSNSLLRKLRIKHLRKPVGPLQMYRVPGCTSMEAGWLQADDDISWHKPVARFPRRLSEVTRFQAVSVLQTHTELTATADAHKCNAWILPSHIRTSLDTA